MERGHSMIEFPKDFIFGVADSDLQVIGEKHTLELEGSTPTMWGELARRGKTFDSQGPGEGVDRYHRFAKDVALMQELGVRHYRTSISMSRILTISQEPNKKAIEWYRRYFSLLRKNNIVIYLVLYHWELPQYLSEQGGWTNPRTIEVFLKHVETVVHELGEFIEEFFILNEPWCSSMLSHYLGVHAPQHTSLKEALQAAHNLLLAQGRAFRVIKATDSEAKVGSIFNNEPSYPISNSEDDRLAAQYADGFFSRWFYDPTFLGIYPDDMCNLYAKDMFNIHPGEMREIAVGREFHTLGANYYTGKLVRYDANERLRYSPVVLPGTKTNDLGWTLFTPPLYPEGLYDALSKLHAAYHPRRIFITENGMALKDPLNDARRIEYMYEHLRQVHCVLDDNIPVAGYFAWTLMDNYEWTEGYRDEGRFGLVHVNRDTLARIPKDSARWYTHLLKSGEIV